MQIFTLILAKLLPSHAFKRIAQISKEKNISKKVKIHLFIDPHMHYIPGAVAREIQVLEQKM